jgi:hypothetical protein
MIGTNEPTTIAPSRSCLLCGRGLKPIDDQTADAIDTWLVRAQQLAESVLTTLPQCDECNRVSLNLLGALLDDVRERRTRARLRPLADGEE